MKKLLKLAKFFERTKALNIYGCIQNLVHLTSLYRVTKIPGPTLLPDPSFIRFRFFFPDPTVFCNPTFFREIRVRGFHEQEHEIKARPSKWYHQFKLIFH